MNNRVACLLVILNLLDLVNKMKNQKKPTLEHGTVKVETLVDQVANN